MPVAPQRATSELSVKYHLTKHPSFMANTSQHIYEHLHIHANMNTGLGSMLLCNSQSWESQFDCKSTVESGGSMV